MENKKLSINFHITEKCNMKCGYCFAKYSGDACLEHKLSLCQYCKIVDQIKQEGFSKISFAGGEPTIFQRILEFIRYAKESGLTTMLISNGALIDEHFLDQAACILDWISISVDSLVEANNLKIGRVHSGTAMSRDRYTNLTKKIKQRGMRLKINTVVSSVNKDEDFTDFINLAAPERWKVLKVLQIENANKEQSRPFLVSEDEFQSFVTRHSSVKTKLVAENNSDMVDSYVMVDPQGRLYSNSGQKHRYSEPLYDYPLKKALKEGGFDLRKFLNRNGSYEW